MATAVFFLVGAGIVVFGLLVMRNPMRLALFASGAEGYYQRMVLDGFQRAQMRLFGMVLSFFGWVIFTDALSGAPKFRFLHLGFLALLWLSFITAFVFGLVYLIIQVIHGRWKEALFASWFRMWKNGMELGPIAVEPSVTPRMRREAAVFTIIYSILVALPIAMTLFFR